MTRKSFAASAIALIAVLFLTLLILVITHTILAERLESHEYTVPEEQRLNMVPEGSSIVLLEDITLVDGVSSVSDVLGENGEHLAYVMDTLSDGADGQVVVRLAFDEDGCISDIQVLETAGLPTNLGYRAASEEYLSQYLGASEIKSDSYSVSGRLIKSIDGADYSCDGVFSCASAAFRQLSLLETMEEEQNGQE